MTVAEKNVEVKAAKRLSKWFKVELTISMFGHVLLHWVYPPQKEED